MPLLLVIAVGTVRCGPRSHFPPPCAAFTSSDAAKLLGVDAVKERRLNDVVDKRGMTKADIRKVDAASKYACVYLTGDPARDPAAEYQSVGDARPRHYRSTGAFLRAQLTTERVALGGLGRAAVYRPRASEGDTGIIVLRPSGYAFEVNVGNKDVTKEALIGAARRVLGRMRR